jgi:hypothetical protein
MGSIVDAYLSDKKKAWDTITTDDMRAIARILFRELGMTRASDVDHQTMIDVLDSIYRRGRSRGAYEVQPGERC